VHRKCLLAVALTVALAMTAPAPAATPKEGGFAYLSKDSTNSLGFVVDGKPRKLESTFASSLGCNGGAPVTIAKKIKVKGSGKFGYSGKASFLDGSETNVVLNGRFVSKKKAKGSIKLKSCGSDKVQFKFAAKWHAGG
jgi:hypothetical protein